MSQSRSTCDSETASRCGHITADPAELSPSLVGIQMQLRFVAEYQQRSLEGLALVHFAPVTLTQPSHDLNVRRGKQHAGAGASGGTPPGARPQRRQRAFFD